MYYVADVIGNSSSDLIEIPSFGIPTLDIENRQNDEWLVTVRFIVGKKLDRGKLGLSLIGGYKQRTRKTNNPQNSLFYGLYNDIRLFIR